MCIQFRAGRPKLRGQPCSPLWALEAPRGARPGSATPQVPEVGGQSFPLGFQSSLPHPRATYQVGIAFPAPPFWHSPCALRPLPLAASRAIDREELRTVRTGVQALPSLPGGAPYAFLGALLSAADVLPRLEQTPVCMCVRACPMYSVS